MAMQTRALVTAKWLSNLVKNNRIGPSLRILDTSWYLPMMNRDSKKEFAQTHIPGASFFDIDECSDRTSKFDHTLPTARFFADYVGNLGIGNDTHVVVFDASDFGLFSCTRVWWMFRLFGHPQVSVLNGGFRNWVREGHPVSAEYTKPERAEFTASMNHSWVKSFEDVRDNIATQQFQVVDVRPYNRFRGIEPEPREGKFRIKIKFTFKAIRITNVNKLLTASKVINVNCLYQRFNNHFECKEMSPIPYFAFIGDATLSFRVGL